MPLPFGTMFAIKTASVLVPTVALAVVAGGLGFLLLNVCRRVEERKKLKENEYFS